MNGLILKTKLYFPRVRAGLVSRPGLIARLDDVNTHKMTLISAPAGFGKTTLLSEWARGIMAAPEADPQDTNGCSSPRRVAWLSLDEGDNDPVRFLFYLIGALQTVKTSVGSGAQSALQKPKPPTPEEILTVLINEISLASDSLTLVLDDYHVISARSIHDALQFLLDHLPANMHLVIATRSDPPLHLARFRGRGELIELRQNDLRFARQEVAVFLNQAMGLGLTVDDIAALASRTEGWIAGLQMAAVSLQGQSAEQVPSFIKAFTGSHRFILDYLVEEVLSQRPRGTQDFLLQTSVLDRLCGSLCDAVVKAYPNGSCNGNGQQILEQLEQANLFIIPLDDERRWFRYHPLFADLLRQRLDTTQPDLVPTLHLRASAWYENAGQIADAVRHALYAEDWERAASLIEKAAEVTLTRSEFSTVQGWLEALPNDVIQARPPLCIYHALVLLLAGGPLNEVEARMRDAAEQDEAGRITGELVALRAMLTIFKGDMRHSVEWSQQALDLLSEENLFFRGFVARTLGTFYMLKGDASAALQVFDEAVRLDQKSNNVLGTVVDLQRLAFLHTVKGQFHAAKELYQRAIELGSDENGQPLVVAIKALIGLGDVYHQWNDLVAAEHYLAEAIRVAGKWIRIWSLGAHIFMAQVRQAQGDVQGAREAIETAQQLAIEYDSTDIDDVLVYAYGARLWVMQGEIEAARRWAKERGLDEVMAPEGMENGAISWSDSYHVREIEYLTMARLHLAQDQPKDALAVLEPLSRKADALGRTGSLVEILALQAVALDALGCRKDALAALQHALTLAEPGGYVRVFVDEGAPMAELLAQITGHQKSYAHELLAALSQRRSMSRPTGHPPTFPEIALVDPLSDRELQVLRFLTTHLSSTEIAEELIVATSTVRSHIKNIYSKLDVHSRAEAVERAAELGLLKANYL
jgi:LuxR family maltose regulon positive regulatory protein